ncbi:MAG: DUF1569 domain-containing protein [Phycisphaerales bacterium JB039]
MTTAPTSSTPINTRKAARRDLKFTSLDDLAAELDRIQQAHDAGTLRATGNWIPGQILAHLATFWKCALDGFPAEMKPPLLLALIARLLFKRKAASGAAPPPGFKSPLKVRNHLEHGPGITFEESMSQFRAQIARTRAGERFDKPSPLFGQLTHDQWQRLQLGHCQLHLSFLHFE